ncbi:uncharacterized protein LOC117248066 [Epinephelus lanceolatus]
MNFLKGFGESNDIAKTVGKAVGNAVESGLKNFLGGEEQKDDGGKEDKEGFSFGKFLSSGDDGQKDVNEGSPSSGQTDDDNSGFGLASALNPGGGGQNDPDNGGLGSGDAKGGGQKNDDNTGAGEPGIDAAAAALGDLFDQ